MNLQTLRLYRPLALAGLLAAAAALAACDEPSTQPDADAVADAVADTLADTTPDTAPDADAADLLQDLAADAPTDTPTDAAEDPDTAPETDAADALDADLPTTPALYADWMQDLLAEHPNQPVALVDIAIPRAHDAGTYLLTSCTLGAVACNTQTQGLSMTEMLGAGIRAFDVRPMLHKGEYFAHHTTNCGGLGCQGDAIASMVAQTRAFLDDHAELVIFDLRHFCETSPGDAALVALLTDGFGERLYVETGPASDVPFAQRPLVEVLGVEATSGKVVLLWGGVADTAENRAVGMFAPSFIKRVGGWSNKQQVDELVADQLGRWAGFTPDGSTLFEFSWTMTMDAVLAATCLDESIEEPRSIESMAAETNGALVPSLDGLIAEGSIVKGRIPNILSVDYADVFVTEQCLRLSRLNLE